MSKKNHRYSTLQQRRMERPRKPTKRQRKRDEQMMTLHGRLQRFCELKGITPEITSLYIRCLMPNGTTLIIFKYPRRISFGYAIRTAYGYYISPDRPLWCKLRYFDEDMARRIFNKLGNVIDEIESGKPKEPKTDAEPQQPVCNPQAEQAEVDSNILKRFLQFVFGFFKQKQKEK